MPRRRITRDRVYYHSRRINRPYLRREYERFLDNRINEENRIIDYHEESRLPSVLEHNRDSPIVDYDWITLLEGLPTNMTTNDFELMLRSRNIPESLHRLLIRRHKLGHFNVLEQLEILDDYRTRALNYLRDLPAENMSNFNMTLDENITRFSNPNLRDFSNVDYLGNINIVPDRGVDYAASRLAINMRILYERMLARRAGMTDQEIFDLTGLPDDIDDSYVYRDDSLEM